MFNVFQKIEIISIFGSLRTQIPSANVNEFKFPNFLNFVNLLIFFFQQLLELISKNRMCNFLGLLLLTVLSLDPGGPFTHIQEASLEELKYNSVTQHLPSAALYSSNLVRAKYVKCYKPSMQQVADKKSRSLLLILC